MKTFAEGALFEVPDVPTEHRGTTCALYAFWPTSPIRIGLTAESGADQCEFYYFGFGLLWGLGKVKTFAEGVLFEVPDVPMEHRGTTSLLCAFWLTSPIQIGLTTESGADQCEFYFWVWFAMGLGIVTSAWVP